MSASSDKGVVISPHYLASEAGQEVLDNGGNAIDASIASAAAIAVLYPHMNGIGGDGFWLIRLPDGKKTAIDASGAAAQRATENYYRQLGLTEIPFRGPQAMNTVAGAVSGWGRAHQVSETLGRRLSVSQLLRRAIDYATNGIQVTRGQFELTQEKLESLRECHGYAEQFLLNDVPPGAGSTLRQERLAESLKLLVRDGFDSFYRGELSSRIASDLSDVQSPLGANDLAAHTVRDIEPLAMTLQYGRLYNLPPPTQGFASLLILALFERLGVRDGNGFDHVHSLVEATKIALDLRNKHLGDPAAMSIEATDLLTEEAISSYVAQIDRQQAMPWEGGTSNGDTIWLGAIDAEGCAVSYIQSLFWEFGSGVVLPRTGILWQNRGSSFELSAGKPNSLQPGKRPFHTLNPALAELDDGRVMVYGTMGGDGQPQTQAAVFSRYVCFEQSLAESVSAPRWLLGKTWGEESMSLKLEQRIPASLRAALQAAGHDVETVAALDSVMGHAGAVVWHPSGRIEGAADPRSDGIAPA